MLQKFRNGLEFQAYFRGIFGIPSLSIRVLSLLEIFYFYRTPNASAFTTSEVSLRCSECGKALGGRLPNGYGGLALFAVPAARDRFTADRQFRVHRRRHRAI